SDLKLAIHPNSFAVGTATISITVKDTTTNGVNTVVSNFLVTVETVVYQPTLSMIPDQTLTAGSNILIGFTVNSLNQGNPTLAVSAVSSDQSIVKNGNLVLSPASASGTPNRTLRITAEQNAKGPVTIQLTATDTSNGNVSTNETFRVTVLPTPAHTFVSSPAIIINDNAAATPYPATLSVSGLLGKLSAATVTLNGFTHHYPSDVGVLLVGPNNQKIVLMDKAGGGTPATNLNLTFNQAAAAAIPQGAALATGSYKPADYNSATFDYPSPAPAHPYSVDLSSLNGAVPNGTWSLYVIDETPPDSGAISNGWSLTLTTTPQVLGLGNMVVNENTTNTQSFTIGDDSPSGPSYRFGVSSTNSALIPDANITFSGTGTNFTMAVAPAVNKFGTNLVTVYVTNIDNMVASSTFVVAVPQVIQPPFIAPIANQTVPAGATANITLNYGDIQVAQNQLKVAFQSSDTALVPLRNISLSGNQLQVTPAGALTGSAVITLTFTQPAPYNLSTNVSFTLTVTPTQNLFGNSAGIVINDRAPA
ncbi:MAG TPA: proprotein convertase P-domain-containing protein, partial [Verrucomicrobiae bacterium]|nr:proprotein convertase P-domain-containing protein [Verrucomicrobiae bacterium]